MTSANEYQAAVESSLVGAVRVAGRVPESFSMVDRMQRYGVPGVAVAVVEYGELHWASGYGVRAQGRSPVVPGTLFQAASISKVVNAVGVLALVESGALDLDVDVNSYLKRWRVPDNEFSAETPVTLRRLLSHTAGTTTPGFPGYAPGATLPTLAEVLGGRAPCNTTAVLIDTKPGTNFRYSGGGTTIVQMLVEDVTGRAYADVMRDIVLAPLGMSASSFQQPLGDLDAAGAACGHDISGQMLADGVNVYPELAAAGLWTTVLDLVRFVTAIQRTLGGLESPIISREMADLMITAIAPGPHGLGPEIASDGATKRFRHNGTNVGFCSQFEAFVSGGRAAVVMTNGDGGNTLLGEILNSVATAYEWPEFVPPAIVAAEVPALVLEQYAGRYSGPFDRPLRLVHEGVELFSPSPYGRRQLIPLTTTRFLDAETGAEIAFETEAGQVTRAVVYVGGIELMTYERLP
jgi:CubicO group peptidase (beta-lactamase class C family)